MPHSFDPIIALSSGEPPSGVALVRLSGKGCFDIVGKVLSLKQDPFALKERYMYYTHFINPDTKENLDDINVVFYRGPRSYTGEDSVELFCHGGRFIVDSIIDILLKDSRLRLADRGEFTKRAYLNGKIDLLRAESIQGMIDALSYESWMCASDTAQSRLRIKIEELRQKLLNACSLLEARIDFPEEKDVSSDMDQIKSFAREVVLSIDDLSSSFQYVRMNQKGLCISIVGEPNSGKSTLTNTLLNKDRCIVSSVPGTTRDYIEDSCFIDGKLVRLIDTAGIREDSPDEIERIGIERSWEKIYEADLLLCLIPVDKKISSQTISLLSKIKSSKKPCLVLISKSDLVSNQTQQTQDIDHIYSTLQSSLDSDSDWNLKIQPLSCKTKKGLDELKSFILDLINANTKKIKDTTFIFSQRHSLSLKSAKEYLGMFFEDLRQNSYEECLAQDLMLATKSLESIIGNVENSEILNKIFDSFCIGK